MTEAERRLVLDGRDGREFEKLWESMVCRFKNAYEGVLGEDVEFALRCEALGHESLLNAVLSRQLHAADFKGEPF